MVGSSLLSKEDLVFLDNVAGLLDRHSYKSSAREMKDLRKRLNQLLINMGFVKEVNKKEEKREFCYYECLGASNENKADCSICTCNTANKPGDLIRAKRHYQPIREVVTK